jgi:polar amino acid transport system substrate-binding protein
MKGNQMLKKMSLAAIAALVASTVIFAGANTSANANTKNPLNLVKPGSLVVGMTLQFKPQMYLDEAGNPAGYDVELVKRLAKALRLKLEIKNMDFAGLIPGLVSKQFDLVSVGLTKNPDREKSIQFVREYMPYTTVLAARTGDSTGNTKALWNVAGKKVTALQGAAASRIVKADFPNTTLVEFPQQNDAFLEVVSKRADAIVVEENLLNQFNKTNPGQLKKVALPAPLSQAFGQWTVQLGNNALDAKLTRWLCSNQEGGYLASVFKKTMGYTQPALPACD